MWPRVAFAVSLAALLLGAGCMSDLFRPAERASENLKPAIEQLSDELDEIKDDVDDSVEKAREQLDAAVGNTGDEIKQLEARLMRRLEELDTKVEARIEQVRASAANLIEQTDEAAEKRVDQLDRTVQARIDQVFRELRLFIKETIDQIRELIKPVLDMAARVSENVDRGGAAVAAVSGRITTLTDKVIDVVDEVKNTLLALQGKGPEGEGRTLPTILGGLGTVLSAFVIWWRKQGQKDGQKRWTEGELQTLVAAEFKKCLGNGECTGQLRDALIGLGVLKIAPGDQSDA